MNSGRVQLAHECNAYCAGDTHCALIYTDNPCLEVVRETYQKILSNNDIPHQIIRIIPAREAPPRSAVPNMMNATASGALRDNIPDDRAIPWLVFYRETALVRPWLWKIQYTEG